MLLEELLTLAVVQHASDLHLAPDMPPLFRIDGQLIRMTNLPLFTAKCIQKLLDKQLSTLQQKKLAARQEVDFSFTIPSLGHFRGHVFRQRLGIAAVFRMIPSSIPSFADLFLPAIFREIVNYPNGLILVTGPTGSGKSTTLAAMVDYLNTQKSYHIITIEDPIEFVHTNKKSLINQRQVSRETKNMASALRAALRQDPDVILLGELRDAETIRLALTAAETGHLVMATLHTHSATGVITRIIDVFAASEKQTVRTMLSESLRAVISQILVPRATRGRIAAFEIMLATPAIRHLIREDKIAQMNNVIQTNRASGMCSLSQFLQELSEKQLLSPDFCY